MHSSHFGIIFLPFNLSWRSQLSKQLEHLESWILSRNPSLSCCCCSSQVHFNVHELCISFHRAVAQFLYGREGITVKLEIGNQRCLQREKKYYNLAGWLLSISQSRCWWQIADIHVPLLFKKPSPAIDFSFLNFNQLPIFCDTSVSSISLTNIRSRKVCLRNFN